MGAMKRMIEDHIEGCRDRLEDEFIKANSDEFIDYLNEVDQFLPLWKVFEDWIEEVKAKEFWDFCADDIETQTTR